MSDGQKKGQVHVASIVTVMVWWWWLEITVFRRNIL